MNSLLTLPQPSKNLQCTLIPLENWRIIKIQGPDTIQYLQGQLTCDLHSININQYTLAAHCTPQGKMINNMYVFHSDSGISLITRHNICDKQIKEMKKYAVFSKVKIYFDNDVTLFGIAGMNSKKILNQFFEKIPNTKQTITRNTEIVILYFNLPKERFLLIIPNVIKKNILKMLKSKIKVSNNSIQWTTLDIEAGYPIINNETSGKLIPQEANIHLLNGISFKKGCYIGQEIIARTQYKKTNKRGLYWLIGNYTDHVPKPGNKLEIKTNNSWKETGLVLTSSKMSTKETWIQAILHHSIQNNMLLRTINNEKNILKVSPLSYVVYNETHKNSK